MGDDDDAIEARPNDAHEEQDPWLDDHVTGLETPAARTPSDVLDGVEIRDIDARIMINFRRSDWINVVRSKGGHQLREPTDAPKKLGHMR